MDAHGGNLIMVWLGDGISVGAVVGAMLGWAPPFAAIVAMVWYSIRIFESQTMQKWIAKRRLRRLARLKAEVLMLETKLAPPPPATPSED